MSLPLEIRPLLSTIASASLITFLLCQRHAGFLVGFEVLCVLPLIGYSVWVCLRRPEHRLTQLSKVLIWLASIVIVVTVHFMLASSAKAQAQKIVDAALAYHASHGVYPPDIAALGYSESQRKSMIGSMGGYYLAEGKPHFFYATTYAPFATEHYDFSKRAWQQSD